MPAAAISDDRLNHTALKVLGELGTYTDNNGWCYPKQMTIAATLKIGRPAVNRACQKLAECGYLEIHARYRNDGGKAPNYYRVILDPPVGPDGAPLENTAIEQGEAPPNETPHVSPQAHTPCASSDTGHDSPSDTSHVSVGSTSVTTHLNDPIESLDAHARSDTSRPPALDPVSASLRQLRRDVGEDAWASWLSDLTVASVDPPTLATTTQFKVQWLKAHYAERIERLLGRRIKIEIQQTGARRAPQEAKGAGR